MHVFHILNPRTDQDLSKEIYFEIFQLEFKYIQFF
jgi:hypothetical protein